MNNFGGLHVLYNNAGTSPGDHDGVVNTADSTWDVTLDVNVTGVARCCRHGIPAMLASGGGSIINVAFVALVGAATPQVAYTASKGALFLASDDSLFMTGQSLLIDGGISAAYATPE